MLATLKAEARSSGKEEAGSAKKNCYERSKIMADLTTEFLGYQCKNPVGVSSCDFGETEWEASRVIDQGIGWLTSKTIHKIDGPHHWPRPFFYSLKKFGPEMKDVWVCSQMFSHIPYDEWMSTEGPKIVKKCHDNNVMFIGSVCMPGEEEEDWAGICRDMASIGVDAIETDTGGPHATFGAELDQLDCGAPQAMDPVKASTITKACVGAVDIPVLFKATPQCVDQALISHTVKNAGAAGLTANNALYGTWIDHETGTFYGGPYAVGGLIGRPWQIFSLAKLLETTASLKGWPVCGVGGIFTWDDCIRYIMAGASVVGLCSSVYSRGVGVLKKCIEGMDAFMDRKGYKSTKDFYGMVVDDFGFVRDWPREEWMAKKSPILPKIYEDKCTGCGTCETVCPYGAITMEDGLPKVNEDVCMGCGWCMGHCPVKDGGAIDMIRTDTGKVVWNGRGVHDKWMLDYPQA